MERDRLPTVLADLKTLQQQLEELHAGMKAGCAENPKQGDQASGGVVIRGK
jgi:hypothetical protein